MKAEENILQAISARAPVPETLDEICTALDCQVGNTVSLISTSTGGDTSAARAERTAARFGMHLFSSAQIIGDVGEKLGSLQTYSRDSRTPSADEFQSIEPALHLAGLAICAKIRPLSDPTEFRRTGRTTGARMASLVS